MTTECSVREFDFQGLGSRAVTARFDGGAITSDAGGLLLREVEARTGILRRFAACFTDHRDPDPNNWQSRVSRTRKKRINTTVPWASRCLMNTRKNSRVPPGRWSCGFTVVGNARIVRYPQRAWAGKANTGEL